ncbi:hypothetical protein D3C87_329450 [compost metagenome]
MDYIFYIIYNSYYKNGNYKNDIPALTVGGIFTVVFFCLVQLVNYVRAYLLHDDNVAKNGLGFSKMTVMLIAWGCALLVYLVFYYNKRYIKIHNQFKDNAFANSWPGKMVGWLAIALMMLSPFIFISIRRNFL